MSNADPSPEARSEARRRAFRFFRVAAAGLFLASLAGAIAVRFDFSGWGFHVNFALVLGVAATILLGVGLMALSFYSDRSGADDAVLNIDEPQWRADDGDKN